MPNSTLVYRPEEYSFDTEPTPAGGGTSILVNDINLELDSAGRIISLWGLCPHTKWKNAPLIPPPAKLGDTLIEDVNLASGASVRLNPGDYWPVYADPSSGWVHITGNRIPRFAIKISSGVILETVQESELCAIWLHPEKFPDLELR